MIHFSQSLKWNTILSAAVFKKHQTLNLPYQLLLSPAHSWFTFCIKLWIWLPLQCKIKHSTELFHFSGSASKAVYQTRELCTFPTCPSHCHQEPYFYSSETEQCDAVNRQFMLSASTGERLVLISAGTDGWLCLGACVLGSRQGLSSLLVYLKFTPGNAVAANTTREHWPPVTSPDVRVIIYTLTM